MKILLINNFHYIKGGSETVYFNTAELLKSHGHKVVFFSFANEKNFDCQYRKYFAKRKPGIRGLVDYFYNSEAAKKLDELVKAEKPDIAHVHLFWGGLSPSIFKVLKKNNVPLIHTCHDYRLVCPGYTFMDGDGHECEKCKRWNYYQCALHRCAKGSTIKSIIMAAEMYVRQLFFNPLKNIDGFVFVSHFSEQKHIQHNIAYKNKKHIVLYNYTVPCLEYDISKKEEYFLYYGRLSYEKGIPALLKVFAAHPQWKLKVVGTGPLENDLRGLYVSMPNIEFLGYHSGESLFNLVRNARFVCVPSECYENNPMTIIEAYSLGTPVIGANRGGFPEIVYDGETGYLFQSGDVSSLELSILRALALTGKVYETMCSNAYEFYKCNFSAKEHYKELMEFYAEIIDNLTTISSAEA